MTVAIPAHMHAVLLTGHGGPDKLEYHTDVKVPHPAKGEVLVRVAAAAVNNTDINTRIGWYSKKVSVDTEAGSTGGFGEVDSEDASWSGVPLTFPLIQGADCCGYIVAVGEGVTPTRIGQRVLIRNTCSEPRLTIRITSAGRTAQTAMVPSLSTPSRQTQIPGR
ncbi:alcohol dehydrogenase catalytic domain-containing protein [Pseudomonas sp. CBSPCBW29]|nr:alcohol dehydrogenase catalytic domain-containing protein [Pseudomonas sp. CBSPCBW29]